MNLELIKKEAESFFKRSGSNVPDELLTVRFTAAIEFAKHCVEKSQQWRPIEEAPKDGNWIIVCDSNGDVRPDYWLCGQEQWAKEPHSAHNTKWRPLPPAPEAA